LWIAGASARGPWLLSIDHGGVAGELGLAIAIPGATDAPGGMAAPMIKPAPVPGPGLVTFVFATPTELHAALDRAYKLAVSLPDAPLARFHAETAALPRATEAERLVIQRIVQSGRCPLTGITEPALLRASHIVPWAECSDRQRLDVHNGLLLSALWDAAFDMGLVNFADDGTPLANPKLGEVARTALAIETVPAIPGLRDKHRRNLASHRAKYGLPSQQ
jgi:hypothetical protein